MPYTPCLTCHALHISRLICRALYVAPGTWARRDSLERKKKKDADKEERRLRDEMANQDLPP
eukprot:3697155-Rhodomonas_salina.1